MGQRLGVAALVTAAFTVLARAIRGVSRSGALAGAVVCFLLYAGAGAGAFLALVALFAMTWITTRWGYQRKQKLGTAERGDGRTASQVLANLGVAAASAAAFAASGNPVCLLAMTAALSEAAADTVSSELGQAGSDTAQLITTWETVPAGTDGGITLAGTVAGMIAAAAVSAISAGSGLIAWKWAGVATLAGAIGMFADSVLGASLERRGSLNNDGVNLLSTLLAAIVAVAGLSALGG